MLTSYGSQNQITTTGLSIRYEQTYSDGYWTITRYASKSYEYVGMTEAAANACAAAKRSQYTRAYSRLGSVAAGATLPTDVYAVCCGADIAVNHGDGDIWSVTVAVNETDVKAADDVVTDPATLFADENGRNYDGNGGTNSLTLTSVTRNATTATYSYTQSIDGFDESGLVFQWNTSESSTSWSSGTTVPEEGTLYCRLKYGTIESNTVTVS